jgi:hypothetical protein
LWSVPVLVLAHGCANNDARLRQLGEENAQLRAQLERLNTALMDASPDELRSIPSFTVGLAASEQDFDAAAFQQLLTDSLGAAAQSRSVRIEAETDQRQIEKVRGMLVQQYLASEEIPVVISNLSFKLQSADNEFKIGDQIVPRSSSTISRSANGSAVTVSHAEPVAAAMRRDVQGRYSIPYEELGGGRGSIRIQTRDVEILDTEQEARAQRQGDISFNWNLNLAQIQVYRVEGFQGDVGLFLTNMRYSGIDTAIGQYQTLRDVVFLFGYGSYTTSVINQIRTPAQITSVDVASLSQSSFEKLSGRLTQEEIMNIVGNVQWENCEFTDFSDAEKIWERPSTVPFPFMSRQTSEEDATTFYLKYSSEAVFFIGDYERQR